LGETSKNGNKLATIGVFIPV